MLVGLGIFLSFFYMPESHTRAEGWWNASHEPIGTAPDPKLIREAVIQVYCARTWGWKGYFATHPWIAVKRKDASFFTIYEKIGWRAKRGEDPVTIHQRTPDARWYGSVPRLILDLRGAGVDKIISKIDGAARSYPFTNEYAMYPGPNSNTFIAYIGRKVPELRLNLPSTSIGKDYIGYGLHEKTPSGDGLQVSFAGLFGLSLSYHSGIEINLLGLVFGIDFLKPALKVPLLGRIGADLP